MKVKLKRTVYIGLGGAGIEAILNAKKFFIDAYGDVPGIIGFLGIDTCMSAMNYALHRSDQTVQLDPSEQIRLTVSKPIEQYRAHQDRFTWMPKENVQALNGLSANGAGQIRTNGRFAFTNNYSKVENGIRSVVDRVFNATNDGKGKWELVDGKIQVYLVFSLCGGTGCGTFIDTAYLIRDIYGDHCLLQAYAVLPSVFQGCGMFVGANAYGALLDMDYLMTYVDADNPFSYALLDEDRSTYFKPFDKVFLIDGKNVAGVFFSDRRSQSFVVGKALFASSAPYGITEDFSVFRYHFVKDYSVLDKQAWVTGLGCCEIVHNSQIHHLQVAQKLVSDLIDDRDVDTYATVSHWVDRFMDDGDESESLLDTLLKQKGFTGCVITERRPSRAVDKCSAWMNETSRRAASILSENYSRKLSMSKMAFRQFYSTISLLKGGGRISLEFVKELQNRLSLSRKVYTDEQIVLKERQLSLDATYQGVVDKCVHRRWLLPVDLSGDLKEAASQLVENREDILRHEAGIQFISDLIVFIGTYETEELPHKLEEVRASMGEAVIRSSRPDNPCQIIVGEMPLNWNMDEDGLVKAFARYLGDGFLVCLDKLSPKEISQKVLDFTAQLPELKERNNPVEAYLQMMEPEDRMRLFRNAMNNAAILLDVALDSSQESLEKEVTVFLPGGCDSVFAQELKSEWSNIRLFPSGDKKSILFFLHKGPYPVFQLNSVMRQQGDYERYSERWSFGFDAALQAKMEEMHFGFMPNLPSEDDVADC